MPLLNRDMANPMTPSSHGLIIKAFLTLTVDMVDTVNYLTLVDFIEAYGRPIKEDNVSVTLAQKARVVGAWLAKKLQRDDTFFVARPLLKLFIIL